MSHAVSNLSWFKAIANNYYTAKIFGFTVFHHKEVENQGALSSDNNTANETIIIIAKSTQLSCEVMSLNL